MSDTLYGITHLFLPSNSTQKSIYCSTNNFEHPLKAHTLFFLFSRQNLEEIQFLCKHQRLQPFRILFPAHIFAFFRRQNFEEIQTFFISTKRWRRSLRILYSL